MLEVNRFNESKKRYIVNKNYKIGGINIKYFRNKYSMKTNNSLENELLKNRLNLYRESYYNELSRKERFYAELSLPIGIATILVSSVIYNLEKLFTITGVVYQIAAIILMIILSISLIAAVICMILSYYNYGYEYLPTSIEIENYYNKLKDYYKDSNVVEREFSEFLINSYCKCNSTNTENNDKRSAFLHRAKTNIIIALIFASVLAVYARKIDKGMEVNKYGENTIANALQSRSTITCTTTTAKTSGPTTTTTTTTTN